MIQTEPTPNPDSLKFMSEKTISAVGTEEFQKSKMNEVSNSFIKELLGFNGVELILLSKNFLSVKKNKEC
ncbi:NifU N-terminal domain-containing protein [Pelagibacteraceae bacterium]|nr:NifU N-terminal domain-containing protein [Pelagibacteraceae bacterium]